MDGEKTSPVFRDRCTQTGETSLCLALSHAAPKNGQCSSRLHLRPNPTTVSPPHSHSMTWSGIPVGLWASRPPSLWCHDLFPGFSAVPGGSQPPPLPTPFLGELPCKEKAKGGSFWECRVGLEKGWSHDK